MEYIHGMSVIKIFGGTGRAFKRYEEDLGAFTKTVHETAYYNANGMGWYYALFGAQVLFLLPASILMLSHGGSYGDVLTKRYNKRLRRASLNMQEALRRCRHMARQEVLLKGCKRILESSGMIPKGRKRPAEQSRHMDGQSCFRALALLWALALICFQREKSVLSFTLCVCLPPCRSMSRSCSFSYL